MCSYFMNFRSNTFVQEVSENDLDLVSTVKPKGRMLPDRTKYFDNGNVYEFSTLVIRNKQVEQMD